MLGKVSQPTKFYTPEKEYCSDETLNVFSNCIEKTGSDKTLFFGSRDRHSEDQSKSQCPNGYAPQVKNGYLRFQRNSSKKVMCLDACESVAVGKFFRDKDKFGDKKALNIGDVIYIPELKGFKCAKQKSAHKGCVTVTQFIEYSNEPVVDVFSGTCGNIGKGYCREFSEQRLPDTISVYKVNISNDLPTTETQLSSEAQASPTTNF